MNCSGDIYKLDPILIVVSSSSLGCIIVSKSEINGIKSWLKRMFDDFISRWTRQFEWRYLIPWNIRLIINKLNDSLKCDSEN